MQRLRASRKSKASPFWMGLVLGCAIGAVGMWYATEYLDQPVDDPTQVSSGTDYVSGSDLLVPDAEENADTVEGQEVQTYVVQEGDTLSKIATEFGLTTQVLMTMNDLDDPNKVYVGQELLVSSDDVNIILFSRIEGQSLVLYEKNLTTDTDHQRATLSVFDADPIALLSPDGARLLYTESPLSGGSGARTLVSSIDGSEQQEVVAAARGLTKDLDQTWSATGEYIGLRDQQHLWVYSLEQPKKITVSEQVCTPTSDEQAVYAWMNGMDVLAYCRQTTEQEQELWLWAPSDGDEGMRVSRLDPDENLISLTWGGEHLYALVDIAGDRVIQQVAIPSGLRIDQIQNTVEEHYVHAASEYVMYSVYGLANKRRAEQGVWMYDTASEQLQQVIKQQDVPLVVVRITDQFIYISQLDDGTTVWRVDRESLQQMEIDLGSTARFLGEV